jgi:hypothetical protein
MQWYTEPGANAFCIRQIFFSSAILCVVIFFPVFHEKPLDFISLALQQQGGYGGVDTTGHSNDDLAGIADGSVRI